MELRARLVGELQRHGGGRLVQLDPAELAACVASVVGAAGASLSLVERLVHLPVGASSDHAVVAEQVQASVGAGPSLAAVAAAAPVAADEVALAGTWPAYHDVLISRTPYRSVAAFPLSQADRVFAVLELFGDDRAWSDGLDLAAVQAEVADLAAVMLLGVVVGSDGRPWSDLERARRRQQVWVAVGMLCEAEGLGDDDAMAMLRGYAFVHGRLLDEVAEDLLAGRLRPEAVASLR